MENSRTCEICNIIVHRACYAKNLRSKKLLKMKKLYQNGFLKKSKHLLKTKLKKYINLKH